MGFLDRFRGQPRSRVRMIVSAGEYVAGEQYDLPVELADMFIARGYADGDLSRHYSPEELEDLRSGHQSVAL